MRSPRGVFAAGDTLEEIRASRAEGIALYVAKPGEEPRPVHLPPREPAETVASAGLAFA